MTPAMPTPGDNLPPLPDDVQDELLAILFGDARLRAAHLQQLCVRAAAHGAAIAAHVAWHEARVHGAAGPGPSDQPAPRSGTHGPWIGGPTPEPGLEPGATSRDSRAASEAADGGRPQQIGPYRILDTLGEGGMGTVYLAEQQMPVRLRVALKLIKLGMDSKSVVARFEQERQALAVMQHDGIAKVFNCGTSERGQPYFVMELVRGIPLNQFCEQNKLSLPQRLVLMQQVCAAVQHAHQKGVVHRDLKPGNVLVSDEGGKLQIKIIDFGLAKAMGKRLVEASLFTEAGQIVGTPEYMAPEQADPTNQDIDTRADIYSLGVMLYELLVGALPFPGHELRKAGMLEVQRILREVDPPKPSTKLTSSPTTASGIAAARRMSASALVRVLEHDLNWVALKALEKDRNRRYETANALAADLQRFLDHEPLLAGPPSATYRLRKLIRRYRGQFVAASAVLLALIGGGIGTFVQYVRAEDKAADAQQRAKELEQVLSFQESQWHEVDSESMGVRLRRSLLDSAKEAHRVDLEASLAGVNFTSLGLGMLEENLFDRSLAAIGKGFSEQPLVKARLLQSVADTLKELGLLHRATAPQTEALEIRRRDAEEHADTLTSINRMGSLLQAQGKLTEAEPFLREALEKCRRILGTDHAVTLTAINDMGSLLHAQGKLTEAEPFLREARESRQRILGADHPDTLTSLSHMGHLLWAQARFAESEPFLRDALEGFRRVLGDDHLFTLRSVGNVGSMLQLQGKLTEAEPFYREVLEKSRRILGDDHPDTLGSISNMAVLLHAQGKLTEAEPFYREALEKSRRILGDDHPNTLIAIGSMGYLLEAQGKLTEAEPFFREALEGHRRILGDDHPNTLTAIGNMGFLLKGQRKLTEAEPYYREALEKGRRVRGADHPSTLIAIGNMGGFLREQGKLSEAEPYYREALEKSRRVLGDDHPNTLTAIDNMGDLLQGQGKLAAAEPYLREALEKRRRVLGDDHPQTLTTMTNMGSLLRSQGKLTEAEPLFREAMEGFRRVRGDDHPDTLTTINHIGRLLVLSGRHAEAVALLSAAETAERRVFVGGNAHRLAFFLRTLGDGRVGLARLQDLPFAEANLLEAHMISGKVRGPAHKDTRDCVQSLVSLYEAWHAAEPAGGHDKQAAEWRAKLAEVPAKEGPK